MFKKVQALFETKRALLRLSFKTPKEENDTSH